VAEEEGHHQAHQVQDHRQAAQAHLQAEVEVSVLAVQLRAQEVTVPHLLHPNQVIQPLRTAIMEQ
jgi:hypothetical protein